MSEIVIQETAVYLSRILKKGLRPLDSFKRLSGWKKARKCAVFILQRLVESSRPKDSPLFRSEITHINLLRK